MTPRWLLALAALTGCSHSRPPVAVAAGGAPLVVVADPKLIDMTAEATSSLVTAASSSELGVRVRITARPLPAANRPPLDLALVLDTSGSMEGASIDAVRASAHEVVRNMRDGDRIAVVAFHSRVDVLVPTTPLDGAARARVDRAIDQIQAKGTTDLVGGLSAGAQQVAAAQLPDAIHRIVLLSDGVPNQAAQLPPLLASLHRQGMSVTTLGLGIDYDTTLMTQIASETGGNFHYIEKPEEIAAVFDDELTRMQTVVARNLQLMLSPGPGVAFKPMPGLAVSGDGRVVAMIGDLSAGETRDLMIPVQVTARGDGSTVEVVDAQLSFSDVVGRSGQGTRDAFVAVKSSRDAAAVGAAVKVGLEIARVRTAAAGAILEAIAMARAGQVAEARKRLDGAAVQVKAAIAKYRDSELAGVLEELDAVGKDLAQLVVVAPPPVADRVDAEAPRHAMSMPQPATAPAAIETELRHKQDSAQRRVHGR
jgi:Ca-activated chloride channel family protein